MALIPSSSARNLGIEFDSELSFNQHISKICRSSFHHIRQLRQIRSCLDLNSSIVLASALVSSKLDYCNSLFYNLPDNSINRLQRIQNSLARAVVPSSKRTHHILNYTGYLSRKGSNSKLPLLSTRFFKQTTIMPF